MENLIELSGKIMVDVPLLWVPDGILMVVWVIIMMIYGI
jgi:hypothetical protein